MPLKQQQNFPKLLGATLVELVISIVIISIALVGILTLYLRTIQHNADPVIHYQSIAIAESYIEEILAKAFNDPNGTEAGEVRSTFDDVDDYHNLANNGCTATSVACPVLGDCACSQSGVPFDSLSGYTVTVAVVQDGAQLGPGIANADAYRVTVAVTHIGLPSTITLSTYRALIP